MPVRRRSSMPQLTPGQANYVLQRLVGDRRISQGELNRYVAEMHREIADLEQRLQSLRDAAGSAAHRRPGRPARTAAAPALPGGRRTRRRKARLTPEQAASRKLQGRYLGLIRQIPAGRRPQYQKIAKEKGREAAIKEMTSALGK